MRSHVLAVAATGLVVAAVTAGPKEPTFDRSPERIARLIVQLGSPQFKEREAASRELDAIGDVALASLRTAARAGDLELFRRAGDLVRRIEERAATARLLAATQIELNYQDKALSEIVADLAKRTGVPLKLHDEARLGVRKTSLTGKMPVWQAVDALCRRADLTEWNGLSPLPGQAPVQPQADQAAAQAFVGGQVVFMNPRSRSVKQPPRNVILCDGAPTALPTDHVGAVRVRALPPGTPMPPGVVADGDEVVVLLQVTAESKLTWEQTPSLKFGTALDEKGQRLYAAIVPLPQMPWYDDEMFFAINGMMMNSMGAAGLNPRSHAVAARFKKGDLPARKLKELTGTLTLPLRVTDTLASIDSPLKAAGQTVSGVYGTSMRLIEITRTESGDVKAQVELEYPLDVQFSNAAHTQQANQMLMRQAMGGAGLPGTSGTNAGTEYMGVSLTDAQGRKYTVGSYTYNHVSGNHVNGANHGATVKMSLTFRPAGKDGGDAVRLAFTGSRPAAFEVPFALRDVLLP